MLFYSLVIIANLGTTFRVPKNGNRSQKQSVFSRALYIYVRSFSGFNIETAANQIYHSCCCYKYIFHRIA